MALIAPEPITPRITHVAGNYAELSWVDTSSGVYLYDIELRGPAGVWARIHSGVTGRTFYIAGLEFSTAYESRIRTRVPFAGFAPSPWVILDEFTTFSENAFRIETQEEIRLYDNITKRWLRDNDQFVDFNQDLISASLIKDGYQFNPAAANITDLEDDIVIRDREHVDYGPAPNMFAGDDSVFGGFWGGYAYLFRDNSNASFFSNTKGQSWTQYTLFLNGAAKMPRDGRGFRGGETTAALLGQSYIYSGRSFTSQLSWSSTDTSFSSLSETFSPVENEFNEIGGGGDILNFQETWRLPAGISQTIDSFELAPDWVAVTAGGIIWKQNRSTTNVDPITGEFLWDAFIVHRANAVITHLTWFDGWFYFVDSGNMSSAGEVIPQTQSGVWRLDPETEVLEKVLDVGELTRYQPTALTTNGGALWVSVDPEYSLVGEIDFKTPLRRTFSSSDGENWVRVNEPFPYYANHVNAPRDNAMFYFTKNLTLFVIENEEIFTSSIDLASQEFTQTGEWILKTSLSQFRDWPGFATGVAIHKRSTGELIAYYEFPWRTRDRSNIDLVDDTLLIASLDSITRGTAIDLISGIPIRINTPKPGASHLLETIAPETYIYDSPRFGEFMRTYLDYISDTDTYGYYSNAANFMDNIDVNKTAVLDLFETDLTKRNRTLREEDRERFVQFVNNRAQDWWGIRGTADSYKYLFRALYDADVEVVTPQNSGLETDFIMTGTAGLDIAEIAPGKRITNTNRTFTGFVNYVQEIVFNSVRAWRVVIQSQTGKIQHGEEVFFHRFYESADNGQLLGIVRRELRTEPEVRTQRSYQNIGKAFYVLQIKSPINGNRYLKDVVEFVHPVGFNIEAVVLLVILLNVGLSTQHIDTRMDKLIGYTWDVGIPRFVPDETVLLTTQGDYIYDSNGFPQTVANPNAGDPIIPALDYFTDNPEIIYGLTTDQRRREVGPMLSSGLYRFTNFGNRT